MAVKPLSDRVLVKPKPAEEKTAGGAFKAAIKGGDVKEAVKQGIETANDIEEGKVKKGFFGKLIKK